MAADLEDDAEEWPGTVEGFGSCVPEVIELSTQSDSTSPRTHRQSSRPSRAWRENLNPFLRTAVTRDKVVPHSWIASLHSRHFHPWKDSTLSERTIIVLASSVLASEKLSGQQSSQSMQYATHKDFYNLRRSKEHGSLYRRLTEIFVEKRVDVYLTFEEINSPAVIFKRKVKWLVFVLRRLRIWEAFVLKWKFINAAIMVFLSNVYKWLKDWVRGFTSRSRRVHVHFSAHSSRREQVEAVNPNPVLTRAAPAQDCNTKHDPAFETKPTSFKNEKASE